MKSSAKLLCCIVERSRHEASEAGAASMRFAQVPEPGAWLVVYSPLTRMVERANFTSLANIKSKYPQAKLP